MPIPFLLAGLGVVAGVIGVAGHMDAKETNEKAQKVSQDAQELYNNAKESLEKAQNETEKSLLKLGYSKKRVLNSSIEQFLKGYSRIKNIEFSDSVGLNEISNFRIDECEALQLREMSDIYKNAASSAATGAAAGAVVALAASGSLPIVTGVLSTAGTALVAGEVGVAAGAAGSALSIGAAMTPLAAIAAPALLFTGISASLKADENLEKANAMYAEAEAASEKMKLSETLCIAISDRSEMFNNLLNELDGMFSTCTGLLDGLTRKKTGLFKGKMVDAKKLTEEELKLVAVTRSLAGAVKAIIDTPILDKDGAISDNSWKLYDNTEEKLPYFTVAVNEVKTYDYHVKARPIPIHTKPTNNSGKKKVCYDSLFDAIRNIFAIGIGVYASEFIYSTATKYCNSRESVLIGIMIYAIATLMFMNNNTKVKIFQFVKKMNCFVLGVGFCVMLYYACKILVPYKYFLWCDIVFGFVSLIVFGFVIGDSSKNGSIRQLLQRISAGMFFVSVALFLFTILSVWNGISFKVSIIITELLLLPFALSSAYVCELDNDNSK